MLLEFLLFGIITAIVVPLLISNLPAKPVPHNVLEQEGAYVITLADGRTLEYYDNLGKGDVIIAVHGGFSTGKQFSGEGGAYDKNLRVIGPTMPGFGGSSSHNGRSIASFGDDVRELVEILKIEKFVVVGASWGAPHALAVAQAMPNKTRGVLLLAPCVPTMPDFPGWTAGTVGSFMMHRVMATPLLNRIVIQFAIKPLLARDPDSLLADFNFKPFEGYRTLLPAQRRSVLYNIDGMADLHETSVKRIKHLDYPKIGQMLKHAPIRIYNGENDVHVTPANAFYTAENLQAGGHPDVGLVILPNEDHSHGFRALKEPLEALMKELNLRV